MTSPFLHGPPNTWGSLQGFQDSPDCQQLALHSAVELKWNISSSQRVSYPLASDRSLQKQRLLNSFLHILSAVCCFSIQTVHATEFLVSFWPGAVSPVAQKWFDFNQKPLHTGGGYFPLWLLDDLEQVVLSLLISLLNRATGTGWLL